MDLPEREVQGTIYTVENMVERVAKFRENNSDDQTVLNYFDELEVHPMLIDAENDKSSLMETTFLNIMNKIGNPRNFGLYFLN
ncbi:Adenylate kinase 7 [Blattella germanica]|nr:Adenylate kinase 7 [Blattella germanica]